MKLAIILLMFLTGITLGFLSHKRYNNICNPTAYYGASQNITDPNCSPNDIRCKIDPCR